MSFKLFRFADRAIDSRPFAHRIIGRMARLSPTRPARADVAHLRFQALDGEADARAA
jgi:hypothetical protein